MAWNLEVKHAFRALEARVAALEDAAKAKPVFSTQPNPEILQEMVKKTRMCPKCGEKPGYFFHVRSCQGKQKEEKPNGNDGITTPSPSR